MSILQFLRILQARIWLILAAALSCFIVATIIANMLPKRYEATARIIFDTFKPDPVTGQNVDTRSLSTYAATQAQLIKDYQTAGVAVDRLGWASNPGLIEAYNASGQTDQMDIRRWLAQIIINGTEAQLIYGSNVMTIKYTGNTADSARTIVDAVRSAYLDEALRRRREQATVDARWFRQQADRALGQLTQVEAERAKYARENGIVLQNGEDVEASRLNILSGQSALAVAAAAPAASTAGLGSSMQLDMLDQQIAQAAQELGPNHPRYQALVRQRQVMQSAAARERALSGGGGGPNVGAIESAFNAQKARVLASRDKMDRLAQYNRLVSLRQDEYTRTAQRLAELQLEADVASTDMTALGDASGEDTPSSPKIPLIMGGALGVGLGLGIFSAMLIELLARRVRGEDDLEYAAGVPVLAIIANRKPDGWLKALLRRLFARRRSTEFSDVAEVA